MSVTYTRIDMLSFVNALTVVNYLYCNFSTDHFEMSEKDCVAGTSFYIKRKLKAHNHRNYNSHV